MAESRPRRGHGEDSIYYDQANHYWVAAVSLGYKGGKRVRRKVTGRTKTEVRTKLRDLRRDLDSGVRPSATYTVGDALDDWLANGLSGRSDRTRELYRDTVKPLRERLGEVKLRELTAGDVQETLDALAGRLSTRSLQITRLCLERAIRHAEVRDLVGRNVAALVKAPAGRAGRPSKSLTLEQAQELLRAAAGSRLYAYVVLSVTTGLRTEELRALQVERGRPRRWHRRGVPRRAGHGGHQDAEEPTRPVAAATGGTGARVSISTARPRTGCWLAFSGKITSLVFASAVGTPLDRHNVLREFRKITQAAGLGTDWVPREMRHTFVSLLSSNGTALEDIADLVGHRGTTTTETVYRKVIVPELRRGAEVMDRLFT